MNRRKFLAAAGGIALGLPFLEGLAPRPARAQDTPPPPPRRAVVFFCCNGVLMDRFFPTTPFGALTAASMPATTGLNPLATYASKMLVFRGVHLAPRGWGRDPAGGDDHMKGVGHRLTARRNQDTQEHYPDGISIDHVIARSINPSGRGPLNLMVGSRANNVMGSISYTGPGQQAIPFQDPWRAFRDWAGSGGPSGPGTVDLAARRRQSVLDLVKGEMDTLQASPALSAADKRKLDLHFTSIRGIETGVTNTGIVSCSLSDSRRAEIEGLDPGRVTLDSEYRTIGGMMMDITALALACDHNRMVTLQWGSGAGGPIFSWLGSGGSDVSSLYNHHKLSHGATADDLSSPNLPEDQWKSALFSIDQWYMTELRSLLDKLSAYQEPGGSVLDNTAVCYMNDLSDGLAHSWLDLPNMIIGSCGGYFKQGQYLSLAEPWDDTTAPSNQLLTTIANAVGARNADGSAITDFGSGPTARPGELDALKA